jgi:outer membrane protein assembly factor BamB
MKALLRGLIVLPAAIAAVWAGDWLTFGGDAQRSGWAKTETVLSTKNVGKLKLLWTVQVEPKQRELASLTAPIVISGATTPRGFKELVIVAGASDTIHVIDSDTGKMFWQRSFTNPGTPKNKPSWLCPNSLNATPVVDKRARRVYLVTTDGNLRSLNFINGEDDIPPLPFVPEFSKNWSLNLVDGVVYTTISQGCNGAKSGVYAIDMADPKRPVTFFQATTTGGAGIWGRAGVAAGFDGRIFAETGDGPWDGEAKWADTFLGLQGKTGKLADYYTPANRAWITRKDLDMGCLSPVVFKYKNWELVAGGGKEGVLYLLDAKKLGGDDHRTPLYRSNLISNEEVNFYARGFWGAMATWEDEQSTRWLYIPSWGPLASTAPKFPLSYGNTPSGAILAFKIVEKDAKPVPEAAWVSKDMSFPEPPIIAGGMVFAMASGGNEEQVDSGGRLLTSETRAKNPTGNAVIHAFDAKTGKELWSSGKAIPGWTHFSGIAVAEGRVYASTWDGKVYAFGVEE